MKNFILVLTAALVALPWLAGCHIHAGTGSSSGRSTTVMNVEEKDREHKQHKKERGQAHAIERSEPAVPEPAKAGSSSESKGGAFSCGCGVVAAKPAETVKAPEKPAEPAKVETARVDRATPAAPGTFTTSTMKQPIKTETASSATSVSAGATTETQKPDSTGSDAAKSYASRHESAELAAKGAKVPGSGENKLSCTLSVSEAPRGGKIDLRGNGFGNTPTVRIGGKVVKMLERGTSEVSVQVPADSNGGVVTIAAAGVTANCGKLEIIGKNR